MFPQLHHTLRMTPLVNNSKNIILKTHGCDLQNITDTSSINLSQPPEHINVHTTNTETTNSTSADQLFKITPPLRIRSLSLVFPVHSPLVLHVWSVINLVTVTVTQDTA